MKVERDILIDAPVQRVYDVVMDPRRLEDWVTIHDHLEDAPAGTLRKGSKLTQSLRLAGRWRTSRVSGSCGRAGGRSGLTLG